MPLPTVTLPTLRGFIGLCSLRKTSSVSANRSLYSLQGATTDPDTALQDVINALVTALDTSAVSPGPIGATTPSTGRFTTITLDDGTLDVGADSRGTFTIATLAAIAAAQAGNGWRFVGAPAVAGSSVAGAAAGGTIQFWTGKAARLTSGNANGGNVEALLRDGIGTGVAGVFLVESEDGDEADAIAEFAYTAGSILFRVKGTGVEYLGTCKAISGGTPNFGRAAVSITADANHTVSAADRASHILTVTSTVPLGATRNVILPLVDGALYTIHNSTTGAQSIVAIGATGTGITIANGATTRVYCDGTNYLQG